MRALPSATPRLASVRAPAQHHVIPPRACCAALRLHRRARTRTSLQRCRAAALAADGAPTIRELLRFTLPSMGIWLANPVLSLIDTSVVGIAGGTGALLNLAALTPATALSNNTAHAMGFLAVATTGLVARARARGADADAQRAVADAVAVAAAAGLLLAAIFMAFATPVLSAFSGPASAALVPPAALYTRIRGLGMPFALVMMVSQAGVLACRDPGPPLRATALAAGVNLVGDAVLCLGLGWGIAGAAWATVAAQAAAATVLLSGLLRAGAGRPALLTALPAKPPSATALLRFARLGGPVAGVILLKVGYFTAVTQAATALSPTSAAAHGVMIAIFCVLGVLGDAVSQAAQSFMPSTLGKPAAARSLARSLMLLGAAVGAFNCCAVAAATLLGHGAFTSNAAVVDGMRSVLPVACASLLLHNASMAAEGMLLAGRDLAFLLRANAAGAAVALSAAAAAQAAGAGLPGVWAAILVFQIARLGQNGLRLLSAASPLRLTAPPRSEDD